MQRAGLGKAVQAPGKVGIVAEQITTEGGTRPAVAWAGREGGGGSGAYWWRLWGEASAARTLIAWRCGGG